MRQEVANLNLPSKIRAGRLLGRAHAALGEHMLSVAAVDSALEGSKTGRLLYSEAVTVRDRALLGKANDGLDIAPQWSANTGKQRLVEVMGRMDGGYGGESGDTGGDSDGAGSALLEKLLLHGI